MEQKFITRIYLEVMANDFNYEIERYPITEVTDTHIVFNTPSTQTLMHRKEYLDEAIVGCRVGNAMRILFWTLSTDLTKAKAEAFKKMEKEIKERIKSANKEVQLARALQSQLFLRMTPKDHLPL